MKDKTIGHKANTTKSRKNYVHIESKCVYRVFDIR